MFSIFNVKKNGVHKSKVLDSKSVDDPGIQIFKNQT